MANLGMNYDPNSVEPDTGRAELFPKGRYVLHIVESDVAPTKNGTGTALKATMEVFEGPFKGRRIFENFNIQNTNPQAQEIAQRQLSALCKAAGISSSISDSQELHYQPFEADVGIEAEKTEGTKTYPAKNKIERYHFEAAPPAAKSRPAPAPAARPAPAAGGRPWQRATA